jgi:hypothetical protein
VVVGVEEGQRLLLQEQEDSVKEFKVLVQVVELPLVLAGSLRRRIDALT